MIWARPGPHIKIPSPQTITTLELLRVLGTPRMVDYCVVLKLHNFVQTVYSFTFVLSIPVRAAALTVNALKTTWVNQETHFFVL